ncbi:hypothetical protein KGO95_04310 [Patescibacteria group bacterium]|nr:hypothetical protein [Patescibacteria group bacterium]
MEKVLFPVFPVFPLIVDYDLSVESLIAHRGYYLYSPKKRVGIDSITSKNFPTTRKGKASLTVEIVNFRKTLRDALRTDEVFKGLDEMGYRPAELHELLALAVKYPIVHECYPDVVALGSVWRSWFCNRSVMCLTHQGIRRGLTLARFDSWWRNSYSNFAVVHREALSC